MLSERLKVLLKENNVSLQEFADTCGLPVETVRNVYYGRTIDPKISTVMKMSDALNLTVNCLMGRCSHSKEERALLQNYRACGSHGRSLIELTAKYEAVASRAEREDVNKHTIPCLITDGNLNEGIIYDSSNIIEISTNIPEAFVGIKISTNDLVPRFCKGDIILLANKFPKNEEYAIFYKGSRAYIRQFIEKENKYILHTIHSTEKDLELKRLDEIEYIGTCIDVIRA